MFPQARTPLRVNNQRVVSQPYNPALGTQWSAAYPKSNETPSIYTWDTPGRGQQGESVTGGSNKSKIIRKGTTRAT